MFSPVLRNIFLKINHFATYGVSCSAGNLVMCPKFSLAQTLGLDGLFTHNSDHSYTRVTMVAFVDLIKERNLHISHFFKSSFVVCGHYLL